MERVSGDSKTAEMIPFDLSAPLLLFPVRHHSPVCSFQLLRTIELYSPDIILIEGPENANELIPVLTDEKTVLPAAIYYFCKDSGKRISDEAEDYRCYYPFLYSSPEYNAMISAKSHGIGARFIDLPYHEILINTAESKGLRRGDKQSYADDSRLTRGDLYKRLCEKTGLRSFEEFWEKYFEIKGLRLTPEEFVRQMHTYCTLVRENTPEEELAADGTLVRERYMAENIRKAMTEHSRVLAVTGGFHSLGLLRLLQGEIKPVRLHKLPAGASGCFPAAYSYEAADALHGYASGMRYPYFYDCIFRRLAAGEGPEGIYSDETLSLLLKTAKTSSDRDIPVSVSDVAAAETLLKGLAALRGSEECGIFELFDSVTSTFIKGEKTVSSSMPLDILSKLATGDAVGHIGDKKHTPPLIADLEEQCAAFRLRYNTAVPKEVECALFTSAKGLPLSRFLHRLRFLGTGFCERLKGPDLHAGRDRSRVREEWRYRRSPAVDSVLIERTTDGFTIEEACANIIARQLRDETRCDRAASAAVSCFLMGIGIADEGERLTQITAVDGDFFSVGRALGHFRTLLELRRLYEYEDETALPLLRRCFEKLTSALPASANVPDEQADELCSVIRQLYALTDTILPDLRGQLEQALLALCFSRDKNPAVFGAATGLLCAMDSSRQSSAEAAMRGYLMGSANVKKQGAEYLKGLFSTARDILFSDSDFLKMTDQLITGMSREDFIGILPSLRLAFGYFTPQEISDTAEAVAALYDTGADRLLYSDAIDEQLFAFGRRLDKQIAEELERGAANEHR